MRTMDENYRGLQKCVINDYPYPIEWDDSILMPIFENVYNDVLQQHSLVNSPYYADSNGGKICLNFLDHYVILAYRFAHALWKNGETKYAEAVYYSMRVRCSIDLFYTTEIGPYFFPTHALGTVIDSHVRYGKLFKVYDGVHIGPYNIVGLKPQEWEHPVIGDNVTLLNGAKVFGKTVIGNNVIVSTNTVIINEEIPDNCIVSGSSPNLFFKRLKAKDSTIRND